MTTQSLSLSPFTRSVRPSLFKPPPPSSPSSHLSLSGSLSSCLFLPVCLGELMSCPLSLTTYAALHVSGTSPYPLLTLPFTPPVRPSRIARLLSSSSVNKSVPFSVGSMDPLAVRGQKCSRTEVCKRRRGGEGELCQVTSWV